MRRRRLRQTLLRHFKLAKTSQDTQSVWQFDDLGPHGFAATGCSAICLTEEAVTILRTMTRRNLGWRLDLACLLGPDCSFVLQ